MDKVADKVSQLVKRNSKEKLTEAAAPESPLPPFGSPARLRRRSPLLYNRAPSARSVIRKCRKRRDRTPQICPILPPNLPRPLRS